MKPLATIALKILLGFVSLVAMFISIALFAQMIAPEIFLDHEPWTIQRAFLYGIGALAAAGLSVKLWIWANQPRDRSK